MRKNKYKKLILLTISFLLLSCGANQESNQNVKIGDNKNSNSNSNVINIVVPSGVSPSSISVTTNSNENSNVNASPSPTSLINQPSNQDNVEQNYKITLLSNTPDLFSIRNDGKLKTQITNTKKLGIGQIFNTIEVSPDSTKIVFQSIIGICVMDIKTSEFKQLTKVQHDNNPSWSPDGKQIIYQNSYDINLMNSDGSNKIKIYSPDLGNIQKFVYFPKISPNGKKITYYTSESLLISDMDGSSETEIAKILINPEGSANPEGSLSWSPNSDKIVFSAEDKIVGQHSGPSNLYVANINSLEVTNLTKNTNIKYWYRDPSWSPDGKRILFESLTEGGYGIFVMNSDGSNPNLIINDRSYGYPAWIVPQ